MLRNVAPSWLTPITSCCESLFSKPGSWHLGEFSYDLLQKIIWASPLFTLSHGGRGRVTRPSSECPAISTTWAVQLYAGETRRRSTPSIWLWGSPRPCLVKAFQGWPSAIVCFLTGVSPNSLLLYPNFYDIFQIVHTHAWAHVCKLVCKSECV